MLGALALAASWFAWSQYWAERQARSGLLAAKSQLDRDNDPTLALLLAAESWRTLPTPAARSALAAALATHPRLGATLDRVVAPDGRELDVSELRFAPDGTRLFALAGDARASSVLVGWDLATGRRLPLALPEGLRPAGFVEHPQGQVVVTLARPGDPATAMQMWSVETGRAIGAMIEPLPEALVPQLLMPDGQHVALAGRGPPQVQVRTLDGRVVLERLADQKLSRTRLLLSHDGRFVHGLTLGMQLHRWQAADWAPARASIDVSAVHQNLHDGFAASPDGRWLAFGDTENCPLLWDLKRDAPAPWTYPVHTGHLVSFGFGSDSRVMASASWDGTVRLWNVGNVEVHFDPRPLAVHKGIVRDVVFNPSPGPRRLATAGQDGRVLLWDIDAAPPLARRISYPDEKTVGGPRLQPGRHAPLRRARAGPRGVDAGPPTSRLARDGARLQHRPHCPVDRWPKRRDLRVVSARAQAWTLEDGGATESREGGDTRRAGFPGPRPGHGRNRGANRRRLVRLRRGRASPERGGPTA